LWHFQPGKTSVDLAPAATLKNVAQHFGTVGWPTFNQIDTFFFENADLRCKQIQGVKTPDESSFHPE
jgi:hypothetical protein